MTNSKPLEPGELLAFGDIPIIVNPAVPADEIWLVQSRSGLTDKRTIAQRTTRITNVGNRP